MISIVVPVYKVEPYICQCIDSILNQTYQNLDVILIDDGSPDNCGRICDEYALKDSRVRVFHGENKGLSAARNLGLRVAVGEYIGFVDSDDWIESDMFESLITLMNRYKADISICGVRIEKGELVQQSKNEESIEKVMTRDEAIFEHISESIDQYVWNKLYRASLWKDIVFPEGRNFEDVCTFYRILLASKKVVYKSDRMYHYRQRGNSIVYTQSMQNLKDYWNAYYNRFVCLSKMSQVKASDFLIDNLSKQVANAASKTWRWIYAIPKPERDYEYLQHVSRYVRETYPRFGRKGWKMYLRVSVFFARYVNEISFGTLYYLNQLYRFVTRRQAFPQ